MGCITDCDAVPGGIDDKEKLVRVIKTPYHFDEKKLKLRYRAMFPPPDQSDVSVVRTVISEGIAAEQARQVALQSNPDEYRGLAALEAGVVRDAGSLAYDYKPDFCGHAHVNHGVKMPKKGETLDAKTRLQLDEHCKAIVAKSRFHPDTLKNLVGWTGEPL